VFIGTHNIVGIRRLIAAALKCDASPACIIAMLEQAVMGWHPQSEFSQRDYDIAFMVKALGRPCLLYALSHAFGLPSERLVYRHHQTSRLVVSLNAPSVSDCEANISTFLGPDAKPCPAPAALSGRMRGHVLQFDNVAIQ
jgi:hypothetical protein